MRRQSYPVAKLTGGADVSVDATFLVDINSPNVRGVRFDQGKIRKDVGFSQYGTTHASGLPLDGTVTLIDLFTLYTGTEYQIFGTADWIYKYVEATGYYDKINKTCTTGALAMTFVAATKKITRGSGSFVTDGFTEGTIITTTATLNPGPFTVVTVAALEIVVTETLVNEGPVSKIATGIVPLTGDDDQPLMGCQSFDSVGVDLYLITNGKDYIQKWTGSGVCTELLGWYAADYKAKQVIPFMSCLIGLNMTESGASCPKRVRWSVVGDIEDVSGTGASFVELVDTSDPIVCGVVLKGKLFIFKENSIWELVYTGGTDLFKPQLVIDGYGTSSPRALVNLGESVVFYGTDNVYQFDGINIIALGFNVYHHLYNTERKLVSTAKAVRACAAYVGELAEYWLALCTDGELPDLLFKYNFEYKSWILRALKITAFGTGSTTVGGAIWQDQVDNWDDHTGVWLTETQKEGSPTTLHSDHASVIWEDDRITTSTDYACFETKDWMFAHGERVLEFRIMGTGGPFTVMYSVDQGVTWSSAKTFAVSSSLTEWVWWLNLTCQRIRLKLESSATAWEIEWIEPWYIPRQRSKTLTTS